MFMLIMLILRLQEASLQDSHQTTALDKRYSQQSTSKTKSTTPSVDKLTKILCTRYEQLEGEITMLQP